jgi:hypothetical protein
MLLEGVCAVLGASKTDPLADDAGLAGREPNSPFVDVPVTGFVAANDEGTGVEAPDVCAEPGKENPFADATISFSFAIRSASFLSYRADHSALVSSSELGCKAAAAAWDRRLEPATRWRGGSTGLELESTSTCRSWAGSSSKWCETRYLGRTF